MDSEMSSVTGALLIMDGAHTLQHSLHRSEPVRRRHGLPNWQVTCTGEWLGKGDREDQVNKGGKDIKKSHKPDSGVLFHIY